MIIGLTQLLHEGHIYGAGQLGMLALKYCEAPDIPMLKCVDRLGYFLDVDDLKLNHPSTALSKLLGNNKVNG